MALRFRTRLTLTISFLVFLTVAALTVSAVYILTQDLVQQYQSTATILTQLAHKNIEHGLALTELVDQHIEEQMVDRANMVAELVAVAAGDDAFSDEDLSKVLTRIVEVAQELKGASILDEIWVTDERGRSTVNTEGAIYTFEKSGEEDSGQAAGFVSLLEPNARPVLQELQPREFDGKPFKYVGVTGIDKPRIILVGVSGESIRAFGAVFRLQDLLERFNLENFRRLMIVSDEGEILASVDPPGTEEENASLRARVIETGKAYLASGDTGPLLLRVESDDIGVFTRMAGLPGQPPSALFIQHRTDASTAHLLNRVSLVVTIGIIMVLLGILVGMIMSRGLSKPLVALSRGAREFGQGNLNYRIYLKRKDEFQGLAQAYNTMAISLQEYMHELEQETSRRERLESEFRIASDVQRALLPERPPEVEGLSIYGWSQPSREVGGDFYDYIDMGEGKIGIALGDATGKGISAALMITECASILRTLARDVSQPGELLARTNAEFYRRIGHTYKFVTLALVVFDPQAGTAVYASAGHPAPILLRGATGKADYLASEGSFPLGIAGDAEYPEFEVSLDEGDVILAFSDGFTDAQNREAALFGEERIRALLEESAGKPVASLARALRESVERHMNGKEPVDDMTLVAVGYRMSAADGKAATERFIPLEETRPPSPGRKL